MNESDGLSREFTNSDLCGLADPTRAIPEIRVQAQDFNLLERFLKEMLLIRVVEEAIAELVEKGDVRTPCHLGIGQEAVAVGVSNHLSASDRIFGGHRSHAHYLALGGDVGALFAEVMGKVVGASMGMGGSMHLVGREVGFHGSVPLVGATIPIAVGAALAAKMDGNDVIAVSYFGDGAAEEGVFHESMNLASILGLPVLFVCENNLFASHLDIGVRQPSDRISRFAEAHKILNATVDGNDVVTVARTAGELIAKLRAGAGPGFLEAVTYRHRGHVGPKDDIDVGIHRKREDVVAWKRRDPIRRLFNAMHASGQISERDFEALNERIREDVRNSVSQARDAKPPPASALMDMVFVRGAR